ncbi:transporter substrate-binding domain-containing protein [Devosia sp.]|uniref:substrate-binding periplasmic protein n=1 Tax=Devosia sp. TaxID=1871048 RepID=UPI00260D027E|nr:transporter substrate-binding domain-containing protein [Devosia sp.]
MAALLVAVSYLPPDTSLQDRQRDGVLKVCVPPSYPPLVTGDPSRPGFDAELVDAIAKNLGLKLALNVLPSIGKDFNPRNWSLTRAQCDIIAGGVADTAQTRSFLQTIPTPAETGWVGISATGTMPPSGSTVAILPGTAGLDRLALSGWLRKQGLRAQLMRSPAELEHALKSGTVAAGITERFVAASLDLDINTLTMFWLDESISPRFRMALGLWKGDQTLKRAVADALELLEKSGVMLRLSVRYGLDKDIEEPVSDLQK